MNDEKRRRIGNVDVEFNESLWVQPVLEVILEAFPDDVLAQLHAAPPNKCVLRTIDGNKRLRRRVSHSLVFCELSNKPQLVCISRVSVTKRSFTHDASNTSSSALLSLFEPVVRRLLARSFPRDILVFVDDKHWARIDLVIGEEDDECCVKVDLFCEAMNIEPKRIDWLRRVSFILQT